MYEKERLEVLKRKNVDLEETLNQTFKERVKKINKYLSRYLYSLLGISTTGALLTLAAFFTPWLPGIATALTAAFTAVSALALPLLITIPIIAVALVLAPIAAFLWKKHQVNSELNNSFEKLEKSLERLQKESNKLDDEFDDEYDEYDEYEAKRNEIKMRQALCIHKFLATQKVPANYEKIDELLGKCGITVEWIFVVDLILKDQTIPDNQDALNDEIYKRQGDQCDNANSTTNQVAGLDKFLFKKPLNIGILKNISKSFDPPKKQENLSRQNLDETEKHTTQYSNLFNSSGEEKPVENASRLTPTTSL